jgi:hypothetical protein
MSDTAPRIDLETFAGGCPTENGFPYPDWRKISQFVRENSPEGKWEDTWNDIAAQWIEKLALALGPQYVAGQSAHFFFVSMRPPEGRQQLMATAEVFWTRLMRELRGFQFPKSFGKQAVVLIENVDDYYRYTARFYPGEQNTLSAGVFLSRGYSHVVIPDGSQNVYSTLAHELAHNAFLGFPLPTWVNEGMAQFLESNIRHVRTFRFDANLADEHYACWTTESIQEFWFGRSFHDPEKSRLSYSLAEILLCLMMQENWNVREFVQQAHWRDAGQAAATAALGRTLGSIAGIFLGEGDWEPRPPEPQTKPAA